MSTICGRGKVLGVGHRYFMATGVNRKATNGADTIRPWQSLADCHHQALVVITRSRSILWELEFESECSERAGLSLHHNSKLPASPKNMTSVPGDPGNSLLQRTPISLNGSLFGWSDNQRDLIAELLSVFSTPTKVYWFLLHNRHCLRRDVSDTIALS